jgi:hypothetical protein
MFIVNNTELRMIENQKPDLPAYLGNRDFLMKQKEAIVQKSSATEMLVAEY